MPPLNQTPLAHPTGPISPGLSHRHDPPAPVPKRPPASTITPPQATAGHQPQPPAARPAAPATLGPTDAPVIENPRGPAPPQSPTTDQGQSPIPASLPPPDQPTKKAGTNSPDHLFFHPPAPAQPPPATGPPGPVIHQTQGTPTHRPADPLNTSLDAPSTPLPTTTAATHAPTPWRPFLHPILPWKQRTPHP